MQHLKLTNSHSALIQPLLPPRSRTGRPRANDRRTLNAILFVLKTGCRWRDLPHGYGSPVTAWRRLRRWQDEGLWERIWRAVLSLLDAQGKLDCKTALLRRKAPAADSYPARVIADCETCSASNSYGRHRRAPGAPSPRAQASASPATGTTPSGLLVPCARGNQRRAAST